uniref:Carbohydrate esterase family 16 protein n=1 Tax=Mycena chlorophos TaxID=658473 RepID=A0ABQ0LLP6_MYCCL|nr:predicted protein [Mycena chlorophos]
MTTAESPSFPSQTIQISPTWKGLEKLKILAIFGDSYSAVGYDVSSPNPTPSEPLGVEFPGITYCEEGSPNWVGYFVANEEGDSDWRVYDYAEGGARVHDVKRQVKRALDAEDIGEGEWSKEEILFVTWVGINDCAWSSEHEENVSKLFAIQETLHAAGARNFLLVNVPPIDRSPARGNAPHYVNWNTHLTSAASTFASAHLDSTVLLFSAWDTFSRLLDDPSAEGLSSWDAQKAGGEVWVDFLHPTSAVHACVARDVVGFLKSVPGS